MHFLILTPFIIQALVIFFDEFYFHVRRGLPLWERIGHPLDTLSFIICLVFVLLVPYSPLALKWYISLSIFSCLFVTKDEWVHKDVCPASEQWLHALLFINHPIVLTTVGIIWWGTVATNGSGWLRIWVSRPEFLHTMLIGQTIFIGLFFIYQVIYWNFIWKEKTQM